jgi:hypothetical protein
MTKISVGKYIVLFKIIKNYNLINVGHRLIMSIFQL